MTTICWDGKTLATDGRCTSDGKILSDELQKIFRIDCKYNDDWLLWGAFAGNPIDAPKIIQALKEQEKDVHHGVSGIVLGETHVYWVEPNTGWLLQGADCDFMTEGSGAIIALSGMLLGLTAVEAVKHAMRLDTATGGRISSVTRKSRGIAILNQV